MWIPYENLSMKIFVCALGPFYKLIDIQVRELTGHTFSIWTRANNKVLMQQGYIETSSCPEEWFAV